MQNLKQFIIDQYRLTSLQEKALDGGQNTVVSASAGTGKTHTLIAKLIYGILKEEYRVDNLLAITYTNAGASEMKKRLKMTLMRLMDDYPEYKNILDSQIKRVETASITTIHGFCKDLISNYGYLLVELDPAQIENVLDEGTVTSLKEEALINTMDKYTKLYPEKMKNLIDHFVFKPTSLYALEDAITKTSDAIRFEDNVKEKIESLYIDFDSIEEIQDTKVQAIFKNHFDTLYEDLETILEYASVQDYNLPPMIEFINRKNEILNFKSYVSNLSDKDKYKISTIKTLMSVLTVQESTKIIQSSSLRFEASQKKLKEIEKIYGSLSGNPKELYEVHYNTFKDAFFNTLNELFRFYRPETHREIPKEKTMLLDLVDIAQFYQKEVDSLKKEHGGMDFDDQIFYANKILNEHKEVEEELRQKYNIILIDEYQDTNRIQDNLVTKFAYPNQANVFRVGDIKQSIYGFQGAEPELMQSLTKRSDINNLVLNQNFRSKGKIIEDVNRLFNRAMNIYDKDTFTDKDISFIGTQTFGDTSIQNINTKNITSNIYILDEERYKNANEAMAYQIARSIHTQYITNKDEFVDEYHSIKDIDLIKEKYDEYTLEGDQIQTRRPFMYKDIVVLVPSWGLLDDLKNAFEHYQIPSDIVSGKGFFQGEFIKGISAWYHYLLTQEKMYLIDILVSSCGLSYDDIIALNDSELDLLSALVKKEEILGTALKETLQKMRYMDANEVLSEIAKFEYMYNKGFRKEDLNNFDLLMTRIANLGKPSISDFVVYLETITLREFQEESDKFPSAKLYSKNDNVVKVMTYHASKGLEFPVVYVWPYSKNKRPLEGNVFYDENLGLVVRHIDKFRNTYRNVYLEMYETLYDKHILEEKIRLFYVALTRAEYRAHVIEVIKPTIKDPELKYLNIPVTYGPHKDKINNALERFYLEKYKTSFLSIIFKDNDLTVSTLLPDLDLPKKVQKEKSDPIAIFKTPLVNQKTFTQDKFKFNQNFVEGTHFGTLVHDTLETLIKHDVWNDELFEDLNIHDHLKERFLIFKHHPLTTHFLSDALHIEAEMPILFIKDNEPTQNIIDLHIVKEDEVIIIDYKTDNENLDEKDMRELLKSRYTDQLGAYTKSLQIAYPDKKVSAYIYSFKLEDYIQITP